MQERGRYEALAGVKVQSTTKHRLLGIGLGAAIYVAIVILLGAGLFIYLRTTTCPFASAVQTPAYSDATWCKDANGKYVQVFIASFQMFLMDWGFTVILIVAGVLTFFINRRLKKNP